jgi:hypothetical protein
MTRVIMRDSPIRTKLQIGRQVYRTTHEAQAWRNGNRIPSSQGPAQVRNKQPCVEPLLDVIHATLCHMRQVYVWISNRKGT